jgi:NADPH-dependent ferric siderophore reductase
MSHPVRRIERVRHEVRRREAEVREVRRLGKNFVAITFGGEELADFHSASFNDHVRFRFPDTSGEMVGRDYTPRHFDMARRELTIEFVLHGGGAACAWAAQAAPGMKVVIGGPKSSFIIPTDYSWHLLAGDSTALPAIHRRIEELPEGARTFAVIQVADIADRREFHSAARPDVRWLTPEEDLVEAVRALALPDSDGFAWAAGEASVMPRLRDVLAAEKNLSKDSMRVAAYWKQGAGSFHETLS